MLRRIDNRLFFILLPYNPASDQINDVGDNSLNAVQEFRSKILRLEEGLAEESHLVTQSGFRWIP